MSEFKKGELYRHFLTTKSLEIEEINCHYTEMVCQKSGASVIHIDNQEDAENLFSLCFQTLPFSSNGVAHILEHTVLCGSKKFPVRDPFFAMTRRSLNTFMNAMTGQDFTCYPAASMVEKDFYNLLEVYLDAVFHPELKYFSFLQEGWRLEFAKPDIKSPLSFKGVVYNEMKGAMNNPDSRLFKTMMKHLYPDLPYSYNSGGDPEEITNLTYEELKEFHRNYYHPSRCLFFFYGNLPLKKHLDFLEKNILQGVKKGAVTPPLPLQKRFTSPIITSTVYPVSQGEDLKNKDIVAFGYLTCHIENQEEALALSLIDHILMENDASILKKALLDSKLAASAVSYFDTDLSELPWILILKGTEAQSAEKIFSLIQKTLKEAKIEKKMVAAAIHQLEFSRTEISSSYGPYGLTLFFRTALSKLHGCDPTKSLSIHTLFKTLIKKVKEPAYLQQLIQKYLVDNPHLVKLTIRPDTKVETLEKEKENNKLLQIQTKLSLQEKKEILLQNKQLKEFQKKLEGQSLDILPKLDIKDVPKELKSYELFKYDLNSLEIFHSPAFTNNIIYADLFFDIPFDPSSPLLALFSNFIPQVGNKKRNYRKNLEYIQSYLGSFGAYLSTYTDANDKNLCFPALTLRGKALARNASKLFSIFQDTIDALDFTDEKRIEELIAEEYTILQSSINQNAMSYAICQALKCLNPASLLQSKWQGLDYYQWLKSIFQESKLKNLSSQMTEISQELFSKTPHLVITCSDQDFEILKKNKFFGLGEIDFKTKKTKSKPLTLSVPISEGRVIASPVSFNCFAFNTITHKEKGSPALFLASQLFENKILHPLIREEGGAYGGGASYSTSTGNFYFYSYRDPNIASTQKAFQKAIDQITKGAFNDKDLEEAKLCALQSIDAPVAIGSRALIEYSYLKSKKSYSIRNHFRKQLITTTKKEIISVVEKHLGQIKNGAFISFASQELLSKELPLLKQQNKTKIEILSI